MSCHVLLNSMILNVLVYDTFPTITILLFHIISKQYTFLNNFPYIFIKFNGEKETKFKVAIIYLGIFNDLFDYFINIRKSWSKIVTLIYMLFLIGDYLSKCKLAFDIVEHDFRTTFFYNLISYSVTPAVVLRNIFSLWHDIHDAVICYTQR